jgi:hypothetical protein
MEVQQAHERVSGAYVGIQRRSRKFGRRIYPTGFGA